MADLLSRMEEGVLYLTKNNSETSYGISLAIWSELISALERAQNDDSVRAIVIDAAGPGFHRGAVMVTQLRDSMDQLTKADFRDLVQRGQTLGRLIANLPKPIIGMARGGALGGGLEMLMRCDLVYTLETAVFSWPEVSLGFVAAWGGTQWGGRMVAFRKVQEMLLLGEAVDGREAEAIGLVTRAFADTAELDAHLEKVLKRLEYCSPASLASTKRCLSAVWSGSPEYGERIEMEEEAETMATGDFLKAYDAWKSGAGKYNFYRKHVDAV